MVNQPMLTTKMQFWELLERNSNAINIEDITPGIGNMITTTTMNYSTLTPFFYNISVQCQRRAASWS